MNLLLDTHAVIWFIADDPRLPVKIKKMLEDAGNNCFISIASLWEIGIKNSLGRLNLHADLDVIFRIIDNTGFELLPITTTHILANSNLDFYHQDPFDRMIIAQSIAENLTVITKDRKFADYKTRSIW